LLSPTNEITQINPRHTSPATSWRLQSTTPCEFHSQQRKNNEDFVISQQIVDNI
jgi:hypothetical protein